LNSVTKYKTLKKVWPGSIYYRIGFVVGKVVETLPSWLVHEVYKMCRKHFCCPFRNMTSYSDVLFLKNLRFALGNVCKGRCLFRKASAINCGALMVVIHSQDSKAIFSVYSFLNEIYLKWNETNWIFQIVKILTAYTSGMKEKNQTTNIVTGIILQEHMAIKWYDNHNYISFELIWT